MTSVESLCHYRYCNTPVASHAERLLHHHEQWKVVMLFGCVDNKTMQLKVRFGDRFLICGVEAVKALLEDAILL